jgi:hypothetical protein
MNRVPTAQLTYSTFAGLAQSRFGVWLDSNHRVELQLVEVRLTRPQGGASSTAGLECFNLVFHGPESSFLSQGSYEFEQSQIGAFELFIVPIGRVAGAIQYEAIFNRLVKRD